MGGVVVYVVSAPAAGGRLSTDPNSGRPPPAVDSRATGGVSVAPVRCLPVADRKQTVRSRGFTRNNPQINGKDADSEFPGCFVYITS